MPRRNLLPKPGFTPLSLFFPATAIAFFYVLMEWLFIITKPSFLQYAGFGTQLIVLLTASAILTSASLLPLLPFAVSHRFIQRSMLTKILRLIGLVMPALSLACLILMMADNFSYTVFKFGIVNAKGIVRAVYAAGFTLLSAYFYTQLIAAANFISEMPAIHSPRKAKRIAAVILLLILLLAALPVGLTIANREPGTAILGGKERADQPNILLITADSLNASATSLYGTEYETTPFLEKLAQTSLVAENAFSNAQGTIGSLTSILTGRYPMDTRVIESDDFLSDAAASLHLPAILKANGYHTVQLSYSYYADAVRVNFQDGFDEANGKVIDEDSVTHWLSVLLPENSAYFLQELSTRLTDRLAHIFFIREMRNPYQEVTVAPTKLTDTQKLERVAQLFATADQPLFIHVHWMTTHGPTYQVSKQAYSAGKDPQDQEKYDDDFYLDAVMDFDLALSKLYAQLESAGYLENTILVISSDHSQRWTASRLLLIIHFPGGAHAGRLQANAQYLDIAPTLLDTIGYPQPEWMDGDSLLQPIPANRPIFLTTINSSTRNKTTGKVEYPKPEPPFYQFGKIWVIQCDTYFQLNLQTRKVTYGKVSSYVGECPAEVFMQEDALRLILAHMQEFGFETGSLAPLVK